MKKWLKKHEVVIDNVLRIMSGIGLLYAAAHPNLWTVWHGFGAFFSVLFALMAVVELWIGIVNLRDYVSHRRWQRKREQLLKNQQ